MKKYIIIVLSLLSIVAYAVNTNSANSPLQEPVASMGSVNNYSYMSVGSEYSSTVFDVGSSEPSSAPAGRGVRRAGGPGGTGGESGYDPSNPQFSPVGDAVLPLLLLALAYTACAVVRKRVYARKRA